MVCWPWELKKLNADRRFNNSPLRSIEFKLFRNFRASLGASSDDQRAPLPPVSTVPVIVVLLRISYTLLPLTICGHEAESGVS